MSLLDRFTARTWAIALSASAWVSTAYAQLGPPPDIGGLPSSTPTSSGEVKDVIIKVLTFVLDFLSLIAVIFIIIGGIRLIVSQGEEEAKDKAKKTILYVIVGLIVVLLSRVIVGFFTGGATNVF